MTDDKTLGQELVGALKEAVAADEANDYTKARDEAADAYFKRDRHPLDRPDPVISWYAGADWARKYEYDKLDAALRDSCANAFRYPSRAEVDKQLAEAKALIEEMSKTIQLIYYYAAPVKNSKAAMDVTDLCKKELAAYERWRGEK